MGRGGGTSSAEDIPKENEVMLLPEHFLQANNPAGPHA